MHLSAQDTTLIYQFMNNELPQLPMKSNWGIFFLKDPYIIDSNVSQKMSTHIWEKTPENIREEFTMKCANLDLKFQQKFSWDQLKMQHVIIVKDTKNKISLSLIASLKFPVNEIKNAKNWISEWNASKPGDRLVNYASIPIFSEDGNYVLIIRGQALDNEGGWDSIFIYKKENEQWIIAEEIILTSI